VDGLHQASGIPEGQVIELHGNTTYDACLNRDRTPLDPIADLVIRAEIGPSLNAAVGSGYLNMRKETF